MLPAAETTSPSAGDLVLLLRTQGTSPPVSRHGDPHHAAIINQPPPNVLLQLPNELLGNSAQHRKCQLLGFAIPSQQQRHHRERQLAKSLGLASEQRHSELWRFLGRSQTKPDRPHAKGLWEKSPGALDGARVQWPFPLRRSGAWQLKLNLGEDSRQQKQPLKAKLARVHEADCSGHCDSRWPKDARLDNRLQVQSSPKFLELNLSWSWIESCRGAASLTKSASPVLDESTLASCNFEIRPRCSWYFFCRPFLGTSKSLPTQQQVQGSSARQQALSCWSNCSLPNILLTIEGDSMATLLWRV